MRPLSTARSLQSVSRKTCGLMGLAVTKRIHLRAHPPKESIHDTLQKKASMTVDLDVAQLQPPGLPKANCISLDSGQGCKSKQPGQLAVATRRLKSLLPRRLRSMSCLDGPRESGGSSMVVDPAAVALCIPSGSQMSMVRHDCPSSVPGCSGT